MISLAMSISDGCHLLMTLEASFMIVMCFLLQVTDRITRLSKACHPYLFFLTSDACLYQRCLTILSQHSKIIFCLKISKTEEHFVFRDHRPKPRPFGQCHLWLLRLPRPRPKDEPKKIGNISLNWRVYDSPGK